MPSRSPLYFVFVLLACAYLFAANLRGWSPFSAFLPKPSAMRGAPIRHK